MKKLLLTVIASLALCGGMFAQHTTHWPELDPIVNPYDMSDLFVAFVQIDGIAVDGDNHYADLEIAVFQQENNVCRGHDFMVFHPEFDDPYPIIEVSVFRNLSNDAHPVYFKMYDHTTGIEYTTCAVYMDGVSIETISCGEDHTELYNAYPANLETGLLLDFTTPPTQYLPITGYGTSDGGYYLVASPIGEINPVFVTHMLENSYDLYWFNQSGDVNGNQWMNYKAEHFNLEGGKGYLYANSQDVTLEFTNDPYEGDGVVHLDYDEAAPLGLAGVNLIGNPFAETAYITERAFYVMNPEGTAIIASEGNAIAPMQGIFVIAEGEGEEVTFSTTEPLSREEMISINLTMGRSLVDRAIVTFGETHSMPKFQIMSSAAKVYFEQNDKDFAVIQAEAKGEMPVNFKAEQNGSFTLVFNAENANFSYLHLIDHMSNHDVDLLVDPNYCFDACTTDPTSRFTLVYQKEYTGVDESFGFLSNGNLLIYVDGEATLQVVDVTGRILSTETFSGSYNKAINEASGVYMLRLIQGEKVRTQKIVIK